MTLCLHKGAEIVPYKKLCEASTPEGTATHVPIPHHDIVQLMRYSLGFYGHEIVEEHHAITEDGARYFGLLSLKSADGLYTDTVGLRNSHDMRFPIGIAFGSRVFVCDNLAFHAEHVVKRKHTAKAKRDLPGLVAEIVEPLKLEREKQHDTFKLYRKTELDERAADHAILTLYRQGVINLTRIGDVLREWQEPPHEEWGTGTAWTLFNATTHALEGKIAENPAATRTLHQVIDGVCETVH